MIAFQGISLVGVGPGDPELLTLAAIKAIKNSDVIAYPIVSNAAHSIAAQIASDWITQEKKRLPLVFPMVSELQPRKEAWSNAVDAIAKEFLEGKKVAFLSQGDVSLFSTSSYVLLGLLKKYPECEVQLIPGVTAFSAAAASAQFPLALQREQLLIAPAPDSSQKLETLLQSSLLVNRSLVLLKIGHRWSWIKPLLGKLDLLSSSIFVQKVGLPDQLIVEASNLNENPKPYFSLLLVRKNDPETFLEFTD